MKIAGWKRLIDVARNQLIRTREIERGQVGICVRWETMVWDRDRGTSERSSVETSTWRELRESGSEGPVWFCAGSGIRNSGGGSSLGPANARSHQPCGSILADSSGEYIPVSVRAS